MENRTLGSILVVAGTIIGAGMLAMPLAVVGVGFTVTLDLLFTLQALMCYTALLLLEVYQHVPANVGLGSLAARCLGRYEQWVIGFCMLSLLYALTAAYISGVGELFASSLNQWLGWQLPPAVGVLLFMTLGGTVVYIGTPLVDLFSCFLFSAKIIFLVIMLALLMPHIHQVNLLTLPAEQDLTLSAVPVISASFDFHGNVSSIISYLGGDIHKLCRVSIIGSFIPLIAYIFQQLATLGSINLPAFTALLTKSAGLNGLLGAIREVVTSPRMKLAIHLFAGLALVTSFLGVSLGLLDYLTGMSQRKNSVSGRLRSDTITFLLPVAFTLFCPRGFVMALGYAGVALAVLTLMLSTLLTMENRRQHPWVAWQVVGGASALWLVLLCEINIVVIRFSIVAELLPAVG